MTATRLPLAPPASLPWRAAQIAGVLLTVVLLAGLLIRPDLTLHVLWDMVIPILPAVFLVNPMLWRNACPLATLNTWSGARVGSRMLGAERSSQMWTIGIVLLAVLVPARRFLFNTQGPALAATILAVGLLALAAGLLFSRRAGFCNALCPVLPVEKLYGQAPLLRVPTQRCADCSLCTPVGCIDLASTKVVAQTVGRARRDSGWVATPFGIFAAAFPGFIIGYFTLENGGLATAGSVYAQIAMAALVSYVIVAGITVIGDLGARIILPILGAMAFALYYWYSAPPLAEAWGVAAAGIPLRVLAVGFAFYWLARALSAGGRAAHPHA
jgi:hypothetical protein